MAGSRALGPCSQQTLQIKTTPGGQNSLEGLHGHGEIGKLQLANTIRRMQGKQPALAGDKGHGEVGAHRRAEHASGIRTQPGGNIQRHHRKIRSVQPLDGGDERRADVTAKPGAQQGIHQHALCLELVRRKRYHGYATGQRLLAGPQCITAYPRRVPHLQHAHRDIAALRLIGEQITVAAIIPGAAEHLQELRLRPAQQQLAQGGGRGTGHEQRTVNARLVNGPPVQRTGLTGAVQPLMLPLAATLPD